MNSKELFEESKKYIPGGVNSPVRAFKSVGGQPFFTKRADKAKLYTYDDKELIDFVCSWGPALFGHNNPRIKEALQRALNNATSFGTPSSLELEMAKLINKMLGCAQMVRMTNSGTEATMSCIRLARGYTSRDKIIKFSGCYHGHVDSLLVKAGSGALTFGNPDSAGIPKDLAKLTIVLDFNDIEALEETFEKYAEDIACVILEPYPANVGLILPDIDFIKKIEYLCKKSGALLIFDEVITGFRLGMGGGQARLGITPDLCALGKIIGGGLPVGAFCGRSDIMQHLSPLGSVYQAGTLSGNPLAMSAGIEALNMILEEEPFDKLEAIANQITGVIRNTAKEKGLAIQTPQVGSLFSMFFSDKVIKNYNDALGSSAELYKKFFMNCLENGVFFAPSAYESVFLSTEHVGAVLDNALGVIEKSIKAL